MNILILGGTGYVGGILKGILSSKGHNIEIVGQSTKKNYKIGEEFDESNLENIDYLFIYPGCRTQLIKTIKS